MTKGLLTEPITDCRPVLNIKDEIPIECDVLLPEYCPDIMRIVSAKATCICCDCHQKDNEAVIEGMAGITVCYQGETGQLKKTEYSVPFKKSYELKEEVTKPICYAFAKESYLNCKAVSKRRLDLRGGMSITGMFFDCSPVDAITKSENSDIFLKTETTNVYDPEQQLNEVITMREEIIPPAGKPEIGEILRIDSVGITENCKSSQNTLSLNGDLLLHVIYSYGENNENIDSFNLNVPINHIWENSNFDDSCTFEVFLCCMGISLLKSDDIIKENGKMLLEAELGANIIAYCPKTETTAIDGFSQSYEIEKTGKNISVINDVDQIFLKQNADAEVMMPSDMEKIKACYATIKNVNILKEEENTKVLCEVCFDAIGSDEDGSYSSLKHVSQQQFTIDNNQYPEDFILHPQIFATDVGTTISDGKCHFFCLLNLYGYVVVPQNLKVLTDIDVLKEKPINKNRDCAMVICYANENDDVWGIACHYRIDPQKIIDENSLNSENFEKRTALLIPM